MSRFSPPTQLPSQLPPGLTGAWGRWLRAGKAADWSRGEASATLGATSALLASPCGPVWRFTGAASDALSIPNVASSKPPFPFTVSVLAQITSLAAASMLISGDNSHGVPDEIYHGYEVYIDASSVIVAVMGGGLLGNRYSLSSAGITTGMWRRITVIFNSLSSVQIYIDAQDVSGSVQTYAAGAASLVYSSSPGTIGARINGTLPARSNIADIRLYSRALTVPEIAVLAADPWAFARLYDAPWASIAPDAPAYDPTRMLLAA